MNHIAETIVKHKKVVVGLFLALAVISVFLSKMVSVNYSLKSYLPDDSNSTIASNLMTQEFEQANSNARLLMKNVSIPEALEIKKTIMQLDGISEVQWLDDSVDICQPLEMIPEKILESWYKDENAVFSLVIDEETAIETCEEIKTIVGENGEITGDIVDTVNVKSSTGSETNIMMLCIVTIILVILFLTTTSWFEPVLFLFTMFIAISINNGTNAFLGEISFITKTTASILQLAVSMDYSIFLLHRFSEFRRQGEDVKTAMIHAMKKSFISIFASGMTTIIGFGALIIMRFKIGPDLGIVLAKGIIFSILSVMILLPALTVCTYRLIDKTEHRSLIPSLEGFGKVILKIGIPIMILVFVTLAPSYLAQKENDFMYGASVMNEVDVSETEKLFGKSNDMVLMVPKGNHVKEKELTEALLEKDYVNSIISYVNSIGITIPSEYVPDSILSSLESENYSRIVMKLDLPQESEETFQAIDEIHQLANECFEGETCYLVGVSASIYDMRNTVIQDNRFVSLVSIIGIGLILILIFKSVLIPLILLLTIESSIWINLAIPYFTDVNLVFIVYMIISAIQLGSTVDYAILYTSRYVENRKIYTKKKAAVRTIADTAVSILTSACILTAAGFIIGFVSSSGVTGQLGTLIGRGTVLSATMVLFLLPTMLLLCDSLIQKLSKNMKLVNGKEGD